MKKLLVLTSALLICGASMASAAAPGINLGWVNCSTLAASANYNFLCDDNAVTRNLIASYRLDQPLSDFVAISCIIDMQTAGAALPPWFEYASGGCREGSLAPISVGSISGCTNAYAGAAGQSGGQAHELLAPNKLRIRGQWARTEAAAQTATTHYAAFVLQLNTGRTVDDPGPPEVLACLGCDVAACFVLNELTVFGLASPERLMTNADLRQYVTYQGGGIGGGGCPADTPTRSATWGAVKALYR